MDLDQGIEAWCVEHHVQDALPGLQELGAETARDLPLLEEPEVKSVGKELKPLVQMRAMDMGYLPNHDAGADFAYLRNQNFDFQLCVRFECLHQWFETRRLAKRWSYKQA